MLRVRSRGLLALSLALMASSGALAYVLQHDAVGDAPALAVAAPGDQVTLKGTLEPFVPRAATAREASAWASVSRHLDNFTYVLETGRPGNAQETVLLTSPHAGSPGSVVVSTGSVVLRAPHPDGSERTLVVILASDLESPILFR